METYQCIAPSVTLGRDVKLSQFINLYGCEIGDETKIGAFVEIQKNATVGKRCKISSHTFVCEGVTIEDNVFVGHNVAFINDSFPRATAGEERRFDRLRLHHSVEYHDRRKCARRRWQRGHQRRPGEQHCGRQSGQSSSLYRSALGGYKVSVSSIPFLDLVTPHVELEQELTKVFQQALRTAGFIGGPMVENFEKAFASFCDTKHSVAVNSGTDALRFALMAAGVCAGDVVVTVPHTFIATTEAISQAGALPEFVDIDDRTYNMDPEKLREYLEEKCTKDSSGKLISTRSGRVVTAIVPVHLYGQMADMDSILDLADRFGLIVVEDACQAHGAQYFSRKQYLWVTAGSIGRAAAFSFYPGKNLGACGEAGAVTTNDEKLAAQIRMIRDHGQAKKYYHDIEGYNGGMNSAGNAQLSTNVYSKGRAAG
jgi:dTDP-4-amino-4,6-dideoxygalactose transaminase